MNIIEHDTTGKLLGHETPFTVAVHLRYEPSDPYAIHVDFVTEDQTVAWILGRDLLDEGIRSVDGVGHGDVRIWNAGTAVHLSLITPEGHALLEFSAAEMHTFLTRTYMLVPNGTEMRAVNAELDTIDWGSL